MGTSSFSCPGASGCVCGCCAGATQETPVAIDNRPGLSAIAYRPGQYSAFKSTMVSRLSSSDYPALAKLKTRSDDDFTIALLDSTAMVLDVLTFYEERLANESYLRTALERRSVLEMAALVGYGIKPGVAAQAYLAFSAKKGSPPVTIPVGTQVRSVPGPGQTAQTFETTVEVAAASALSSLPVQSTEAWQPAGGDRGVYLAGTATQINPGDVLLLVGDERPGSPGDPHWKARAVATVTADTKNQRTLVTWSEGLDATDLPQQNPRVFVFRQRAALFGYNAISPAFLTALQLQYLPVTDGQWTGFALSGTIDLDASYPKITQDSWVLLASDRFRRFGKRRGPLGILSLYQALSVSTTARTAFGISAKISSIEPDSTTDFEYHPLRTTLALCQSEEVPVAPQPLLYPLYGSTVDLQSFAAGLVPGQALAFTGRPQKILVRPAAGQSLSILMADGTARQVAPGDVLVLAAPVLSLDGGSPQILDPSAFGDAVAAEDSTYALQIEVADRDGATGTLTTTGTTTTSVPSNLLGLVPSADTDPFVQEIAFISDAVSAVTQDRNGISLQLSANLTYCYERLTTTVNAIVATATHGESVTEIMGSGSASTANQEFPLKQSPVTCLSAPTPTGEVSTLQVRVNDSLWNEVASLYGAGPTDRSYVASLNDDGTTTVLFGDGVEGARLPTGQNNVRSQYRKGLGAVGNVGAGALITLLDRPLGVTGVINPGAATGGQDAQSIDDARQNLPLTALTIDRVVSLEDYANYARSFSGIAKAQATWTPSGPSRGITITVAGVEGATIDPTSDTSTHLGASLRTYGDPFVPIQIQPFDPVAFFVALDVMVDPSADSTVVLPAVEQALRAAFSFDARDFGQGVSVDEIDAVVQAVPGVVALNVRTLRPETGATGTFRLSADPDQIMTLDPGPLDLGVMS
jgi:hypothetical protein